LLLADERSPTKEPRQLKEITMKNTSAARKLSRFQYAATLLGALAFVALAPATAHADTNGPTGPSSGCHYTDPDGYDIPIDEGQGVIVGGKLVTCTGGTIVVSTAPAPNINGVRPTRINPNLPVSTATPNRAPVLTRNAQALQTP
jgi:hypothetical protein